MTLDHLRKCLVGFQALPFQLGAPVLEELPCPGLAVVVPELTEGFFQQVSGVEALVGGQQEPQVFPSAAGEVLRVRQQRVLLALDEATLLALVALHVKPDKMPELKRETFTA